MRVVDIQIKQPFDNKRLAAQVLVPLEDNKASIVVPTTSRFDPCIDDCVIAARLSLST